MFLKQIALRKVGEQLEAWDEATESFVPASFTGRIDLTDRFLSNFNKPTRRRMLFTDNETGFPASLTFRHPGTLDVYLLGIRRQDALEGTPYLALTVCHLVTDEPGGSSGLTTITRKVPQGPADDPGWLVDTVVAKAFMDMEFRTSANEAGTSDLKIENYYAFLPRHIVCEPWDFAELHGRRYRVVDTFSDSGFAGLRIDLEEDTRKDFVLHAVGQRVYDQTLHQFVNGSRDYNVTGVMENSNDFARWVSDASDYIDVYFEANHVPYPFEINPGSAWLILDGRKREVKSISSQSGNKQYKLRCM